jgi:hypothetical protein
MLRKAVLLSAVTVCTALPAGAQVNDEKLAFLIPNLFGPNGLVVDSEARLPDGSTHSAHFNSAFQSEFTQFNIALASQIANVSLPSPASGYTYTFDPALGVFQRSTQSFGPILADRAETIGRKKFTFGFNYQRFSFDTIEGVDLDAVPAVFTHDDFQLGGGRADVVTTRNSIKTTVGQFNAFFTYGVSDRFDVSVAIPIVAVDMQLGSHAEIQRIGTTGSPATHFFRDSNGALGGSRTFAASGSASGIGDVILRMKGAAPKSGPTSLAFALDVRFPTGDEKDLLGSGSFGFKPTLALSWAVKKISPHLNLGYQWNGRSILAGDVKTNAKGDLPNQFIYTAGVDWGLTDKITLGLDILGRRRRRAVPADRVRARILQRHERLRGGEGELRRQPAARPEPRVQARQRRPARRADAAGGVRVQLLAVSSTCDLKSPARGKMSI